MGAFLNVFWATIGVISALWVAVVFGYCVAFMWRGILRWGRQKNCEHDRALIIFESSCDGIREPVIKCRDCSASMDENDLTQQIAMYNHGLIPLFVDPDSVIYFGDDSDHGLVKISISKDANKGLNLMKAFCNVMHEHCERPGNFCKICMIADGKKVDRFPLGTCCKYCGDMDAYSLRGGLCGDCSESGGENVSRETKVEGGE